MSLVRPAEFYAALRATAPLGPKLTAEEVDGCKALLTACAAAPLAYAACMFGTAYHETAGTLRPIAEYGKGHGKPYGRPGLFGGQAAYGRGYVQLTWDGNYERADRELQLHGALLADFDLALDPLIAARIMRRGMEEGWFTHKRLADYLPAAGAASRAQFIQSRRIINGTDKAALIAGHCLSFQAALQAGGWTP